MNKENYALKLVDEIILYYDARSKKLQNNIPLIMIINRIYELKIFCRCSLFPSWSG